MNITVLDRDLLSLDLIGDGERGYDFLDQESLMRLKQHSSPEGMLSVYLDLRPGVVQRNPALLRFENLVREISKDGEMDWKAEEKRLFERLVEDITMRLEAFIRKPNGRGLALFAAPRGMHPKRKIVEYALFHLFNLPEAPMDLVRWSHAPVLAPLLVQVDEHPETGVVLFDKFQVRFFLYYMGDAAEYALKMMHEEPIATGKARSWHGYGTHNHQQWQQEHYRRYLRQAGIAVSKIADKAGWKWLVLASPDRHEARRLGEFLPESVRGMLIGEGALPMDVSLNEVRDLVTPMVRQAEMQEERRLLEEWVSELSRDDGLAVCGISDTALAAQQYRLRTLIFPADFVHRGWQCPTCHSLTPETPDASVTACPYCGSGDLIEMADILGEIALQTLMTNGHVEVVREREHLGLIERHGSVGGLLRY